MSFVNGSSIKNQVRVVLGAQWGDEGKGKLVDILAERRMWSPVSSKNNNLSISIVYNIDFYFMVMFFL